MSGGGVSWAQLIVTPGWASTSAGPMGPLAAGCVGAVVPVAASRLARAAVTTVSGVKPNSSNRHLAGRTGAVVVDADNPPGVTDEVAPTDTDPGLDRDAGLDLRRMTESLYPWTCSSNHSRQGIDTIRAAMPWSASSSWAVTTYCTSEPVPIKMTSGVPSQSLRMYPPWRLLRCRRSHLRRVERSAGLAG